MVFWCVVCYTVVMFVRNSLLSMYSLAMNFVSWACLFLYGLFFMSLSESTLFNRIIPHSFVLVVAVSSLVVAGFIIYSKLSKLGNAVSESAKLLLTLLLSVFASWLPISLAVLTLLMGINEDNQLPFFVAGSVFSVVMFVVATVVVWQGILALPSDISSRLSPAS